MSQTEKPSGTPGNRRFGVRRKPRGLGKVPGSVRAGNVQLAHQLLDVSRSGARLLVRSELQKGAVVYVALPWPSKAQQDAVAATVAWCVATANDGFCVGVQFHRLLSEEELSLVLGPTESAILPPTNPSAPHRNQPAPPLR
jgi:PilZ domain